MAKQWLVDNGYELYSFGKFVLDFGLRTPVDFGIGPDFIARKNNEVFFIQCVSNQARLKKYSQESLKIAKEHCIRTMAI